MGPQAVGRPSSDVAPAPAREHVPLPPLGEGVAPWVALVAVFGWILARGVVPALPGSGTGLGAWIDLFERVTAILTYVALFGLEWLLLSHVVNALRRADLPVTFRLFGIPVATGAMIFVLFSVRDAQEADVALVLGGMTAIVALSASPIALARPSTRAPGLVVAAVAVGCLLAVGARAVALSASAQALSRAFDVTRTVVTVAFVCEVVAALVAGTWMARRRVGQLAIFGLVIAASAVLVVVAARTVLGASVLRVTLARTLVQLLRHPAPWIAPAGRMFAELVIFGVALIAAFPRRGERGTACAAIALALSAHGASDVPFSALALVTASFLLVGEIPHDDAPVVDAPIAG